MQKQQTLEREWSMGRQCRWRAGVLTARTLFRTDKTYSVQVHASLKERSQAVRNEMNDKEWRENKTAEGVGSETGIPSGGSREPHGPSKVRSSRPNA